MTGPDPVAGKPRATWTPSEPAQFLLLLGRHWKLLVLSALAGVVALFGVMFVVSPSYDISAKLLLRLGREMTAPALFGAREGAQVMPAAKRPEDIASEVEILSNPRLITRVVEHFGEDFFLAEVPAVTLWQQIKRVPKEALRQVRDAMREGMVMVGLRPPTTPLERVTLAIGEGLRVESVRKSDVIEIKLGFPDPHAGVLLMEKFIEFALESHVQAHRTPGVREFFAAEREARSRELREAEERLLAMRAERTATWSAPEQRALLLKAEADLMQQQTQALAEAAQASAEIEHAQAALKALPSEVKLSSAQARNRMSDDLRSRLIQLELELANLKARNAEESPLVGDVQRQVDLLRRSIEAEPAYHVDVVTTGANQRYEALARDLVAKQNSLEGQRARAEKIAARIALLREQVQSIQAAEIEIAQLERDVARLRRGVELYEKGLEDARIAEAMDAAELSSLHVVMPPTAELLPSYPPVRRFLMLGFAGGLALAIGFLVLREVIRGAFRDSSGDAEAAEPAPAAPVAAPAPRRFSLQEGSRA